MSVALQEKKLSKPLDYKTLLLLTGMYALLGTNVYFYVYHRMPLWIHVLISAVAIHLAFTIWHEAAHDNLSDKKGLNNVLGILGMLPYMTPYFTQKWIHIRHHIKLNTQEDPNLLYVDGPFWQIPFRYVRAIPYLRKMLQQDPLPRAEKIWDSLSVAFILTCYGVGLWKGVLMDMIYLWVLPWGVAKLIMDWYINYLPHVGLPSDRFKGTRIVDLAWLTPLVLKHNYHAIHHLWPWYPWHRYTEIFREKRDYLEEQGVPIVRTFASSTV